MKLCRFLAEDDTPRVGAVSRRGDALVDLAHAGIHRLDELLEEKHAVQVVEKLMQKRLPQVALSSVTLLAPVDRQEVWAVGVTYLRSKAARMDESDFSATAYDRVYEAERPELFFKALPHKVVGPGKSVGIRSDAHWNVPEPELALVINSKGDIAGYTIGNDMSSRDIEGANLLYLPQAKIYDRSCALGPFIVMGASEATARTWTISISIQRRGRSVFEGETRVANIRRTFAELRDYLYRSQTFASGAVLLTGTGVVPSDDFTLRKRDTITIDISGIGTLVNTVTVV